MHTTLDQLEKHIRAEKPMYKYRRMLKEVKVFATMFLVIYIVNTVVSNFHLFVMAVSTDDQEMTLLTDLYQEDEVTSPEVRDAQKTISHYTSLDSSAADFDKDAVIEKQKKERKINDVKRLFQQHTPAASSDFEAALQTDTMLRQKLNDYSINFNKLPPVNRVIIPDYNVDVPLLKEDFGKPIEEVTNDDFAEVLTKGVAIYPTTATPSHRELGVSLIFGHSSDTYWKDNRYKNAFTPTVRMKPGELVNVVWNGQLIDYAVEEVKIIRPWQIDDLYQEYSVKGNYIFLIACYPLGSSTKRSVVIAKLAE